MEDRPKSNGKRFPMILGIHSGHDCGAAISSDGKLLAAVNEERITRNKMAFGVPKNSVDEVMRLAGAEIGDIEEIAIETIGKGRWLRGNGKPWLDKIMFTNGKALFDFFYIKGEKLKSIYGLRAVLYNLLAASGIPRFLLTDALTYFYVKRTFGLGANVTFVNHHDAHLASAYFTSGFDEALSVVIEEYDGLNALKVDHIKDGAVTPLDYSPYPHSPGVFYSLITRILGYNQILHAGKITGLASYGDSRNAYHLVENLMWAEGMQVRLSYLVYNLAVEYASSGKIPAYFRGYSKEDLAAAFQARLEDVISTVVGLAVDKTEVDTVILCGGVAANVKMNQRIFGVPGVKKIYVHPGMSDCGVAAGAALWAHSRRKKIKPYRLKNVFLGTDISNLEIESALKTHNLKYTEEEDIHRKVAELLNSRKIVARVMGKMEYGPRALGARSILYHCSDVTVNDWLNKRLKRTEFMPFAPAVLAEKASEYFEDISGAEYAAEFMTITFKCTELMQKQCPAVTHVDNTARPQLVTAESNPDLHSILMEYYKMTDIPAVINTSYNIHDEPIVRTVEDALRVFKVACLDYLAIGDFLVSADANNLSWKQ